MRLHKVIFAACTAVCLMALAGGSAQAADPTLGLAKKRGQVLCGVNGQLPGFSALNDKKEMAGFEVEYCRAIWAMPTGSRPFR
jgi:general L-amino acid transport system substrate-binding protein